MLFFVSHFPLPRKPAAPVLLWAGAAAALLCGCQVLAPPPPASPPPLAEPGVVTPATPTVVLAPAPAPEPAEPAEPAPDPVAQVLAHAARVQALAAGGLPGELARLEAHDAAATPQGQLQLATVLGLSHVPADTARALGLVQRALNATSAEAQALRPLARLLESLYLQQRRLEELAERQGHQLREAQRKNDQLSERLEAVLAIERSLTTRPPLPMPRPLPRPSAPAPGR